MHKLKIIFLITNLLIITSCDEKKNSTEVKALKIQDYDGDLIPNAQDQQPYVVNSPLENFEFEISSNQFGGNGLVSFDYKNFDKTKLLTYLTQRFRDEQIKYSIDLKPTTMPIKIDRNQKINITSSFNFKKNVKNLSFSVKDHFSTIFSGKVNANGQLNSVINSTLIANKKLTVHIKDFEFKQGNKQFTYKEFLNSVKKRSFKISFIKKATIKSHRLAYNITLKKALEHLGHSPDDLESFFDRNSLLFVNDLQQLKESDGSWIILNKPKGKIKAAEHIIFVWLTAKEIKDHYNQATLEEFNSYKAITKIELDALSEVSLKIQGDLQFLNAYKERLQALYPASGSVHPCPYFNFTANVEDHTFDMSNIKKYFDFYLDGKKTSPLVSHHGDFLIFKNISKKTKLEIKLKSAFNHMIDYGQKVIQKRRQGEMICQPQHYTFYEDRELLRPIPFKFSKRSSVKKINLDIIVKKNYLIH